MNELRMHVEQLFRGRTMDDELIELKEEIFGNLMARYEDLIARGVSEEDALAQTKASVTSVDEMKNLRQSLMISKPVWQKQMENMWRSVTVRKRSLMP